ncbi:DnaJ domain-containing protein [Leptolyngbya cf. ectocarpi LEGE 11479]|uniref:DnaJ domain-containing protein n=1 Tax=Leptolyngbya cf. ectocarpi LEGE 11479 TaxID=1828722 RepID=A0A928ZX80_LEPEC|nr:J domain-containing protein [Leptolyngbya ectocarpi]MBE9069100.1 DnaJ domain-containing protein [Leptolyngbya cf. ectocarpi LEGE 11479]
MATADDYYSRLQVSPDASQAEIKAAFRRLARRYHPDLNPDDPRALEKFRALHEAYEVLTDQVQRQRYDHTGTTEYSGSRPQTAHDFYLRGIQQTLARRYKAALADFNQAIERQPDLAEAYLRRAQVRYILEDDAGVLADCQRLLQFSQRLPQTYYYLGLARYRLGYTESALAAFSEAIAQEPDDPQTYFQRGVAYADIQEWNEAANDFQTASMYYQAQGDLDGYQRSCDRIRHLRKQRSFRLSHRTSGITRRWGLLGQLNRLLFGLLGNPAEELTTLYSRFSQQQARQVGCLLATLGIGGFTLGGYVLRFAGNASQIVALGGLWLSGCTVFLSLIIALAISRLWLRRHGSWASDTFIAGATVLPMGLFVLISPMALVIPWLWLLFLLIALHHTFITLYSGCHQIHHHSEVIATWLAPSLLFMGITAGYLVWNAWL